MRIVLASASPRRRDLLAQLGLRCDVVIPSVDEERILAAAGDGPVSLTRCGELVTEVALAKANQVAPELPAGEASIITIAADTAVVVQGRLLGKPASAEEARAMLRRLSGRVHDVVTGLAVRQARGPVLRTASAVTRVRFRTLSEALIDAYVRTGEPMDKAGAYGIQGYGATLVEGIDGCYFNVVGLPLGHLARLLEDLGVPVWGLWEIARPER